jgi:hypothetical protein
VEKDSLKNRCPVIVETQVRKVLGGMMRSKARKGNEFELDAIDKNAISIAISSYGA